MSLFSPLRTLLDMATFQDGNVRRATANTVTAMRRSAERRQCPSCGRKSALVSFSEDWGDRVVSIESCRWKAEGKCDHQIITTLIEWSQSQ